MTDQMLKNITRYNIIIGMIYIVLSIFFWSFSKTVGVTLGVILMTLNFYLMIYLVKKVFTGGKIKPIPLALYITKFLILIALIFLVLSWQWVNKVFFLLGTTVILASLILTSLTKRQVSEDA